MELKYMNNLTLNVNSIPKDMWNEIFSYMSFKEVKELRKVCSIFNQILQERYAKESYLILMEEKIYLIRKFNSDHQFFFNSRRKTWDKSISIDMIKKENFNLLDYIKTLKSVSQKRKALKELRYVSYGINNERARIDNLWRKILAKLWLKYYIPEINKKSLHLKSLKKIEIDLSKTLINLKHEADKWNLKENFDKIILIDIIFSYILAELFKNLYK